MEMRSGGKEGGETGIFTYPAGMLNLEHTLSNGQLFRWRKSSDGWWDVVTGPAMIRVRHAPGNAGDPDAFEFQTFPTPGDSGLVARFFRLDVDLQPVYEAWRSADPYLGDLTERFRGLRIVRQ